MGPDPLRRPWPLADARGGGDRRGGLALEPGQLVVDRLVARDVGVAGPLVEPLQVVEQPGVELDLQVAGRPDADEYSGRPTFFETPTLSFKGMAFPPRGPCVVRRGDVAVGDGRLPGDLLELELP